MAKPISVQPSKGFTTFSSYCPNHEFPRGARPAALAPSRCPAIRVRKAGRKASCLSRVLPPDHSADEMRKPVAASVILGFSRRMDYGDNAASKLCAEVPRHTQVMRLSAAYLRSPWQGAGKALPVASPPLCRKRHAETVPVSAPSAWQPVTAFPSQAVRP
jgi:hypothetical protein